MVSCATEMARPAVVRVRLDLGRGNTGAHAQGRNNPDRGRRGGGATDSFWGRGDIVVAARRNRNTADDGAAGAVQVHNAFREGESRPADTRRPRARGRVGIPIQEL